MKGKKCQASIEEDDQTLDRRRAYYLQMSYEDFVKRKAELLRQAESFKGMGDA